MLRVGLRCSVMHCACRCRGWRRGIWLPGTSCDRPGEPSGCVAGRPGTDDGLSVQDRPFGLAFPGVPAANTGMGLRIMNYRARVIGAAFEVGTDRESGTVVHCAVPIKSGSQ